METTAPCERCGRSVSTDAITCPECGYSPLDSGAIGRKLFLIVGVILTGTLVGAPLGLPMIIAARYIEKSKRERGPTGRAKA